MNEILCSTGALIGRPNGRNYKLLEFLTGQLSCDGFEFMMYDTWYGEVDALVNTLTALQLHIPVVHCEKRIGEAISKGGKEELEDAYHRFEINCGIAEKLQAKKIVMHLWDGITSDANFENNIKAYPQLTEIAGSYNMDLLVENVVCNHESPMQRWCELAEKYPDIHFIFDTKMAAFHEQLDLLYDEKYEWLWKEGHIRHYHVNDYGGGYKDWKNLRTLPIGKGHADFERFFKHLQKTGYEGTLTVESTAFNAEGVVDIKMLNDQFEYIRKALTADESCF
ncbi:MAG: sugar phosphate isomerase/epimerase [Lachnospiraceae bacterium]|nr:sugar phosphate isomerase/epimerase [Lachnospiraceae bacterium]